jgi:hypothetical protein
MNRSIYFAATFIISLSAIVFAQTPTQSFAASRVSVGDPDIVMPGLEPQCNCYDSNKLHESNF